MPGSAKVPGMLLFAQRNLVAVALLAAACGGSPPKPAEAPPAPAGAALEPKEEAPDLSPVGAPAGLFAVGRWQRPLAQVDTLGNWLGVPGSVLNFVPERYEGLVQSVDGDAPVEFAAVLTRGKGSPVDWVASLGVKSLAQAVEEARALGAEVTPKAPGIVSVSMGRNQPTCAVALSLGRAPARLVCSSSERMLDAQLPFATRGLPTLPLGSRDLELELRLAPLREGYQKELASAPGFGSFFARQLELDSPRLDRATADAVKALIEEGVTLVSDVDVIALGGGLDASKGELTLDVDLRFRDQKSFVAGLLQDASREGAPPDGFFTLPASATSGGYSRGFDTARWTGLRSRLVELVDAFLEHDKVGRPSRDRARRFIDTYFELSGARSLASGPPSDGATGPGVVGYGLQLIENPSKPVIASLADANAFLADRQVRAMLAKRLSVPEKVLPKASLVPLQGPGIPAGTRALVLKLPKEFYDGMNQTLASKGLASKRSRGSEPDEMALVAVARGEGTVVATAGSTKELAKVLGDFLSGKGPTLKERAELLRFERMTASGAYFVTLAGLVTALAESTGNSALKSTGPASSTPVFFRYQVMKGTTRFGVVVPKGLFTGIQSLVPALMR
jgi:hypothetical protein